MKSIFDLEIRFDFDYEFNIFLKEAVESRSICISTPE